MSFLSDFEDKFLVYRYKYETKEFDQKNTTYYSIFVFTFFVPSAYRYYMFQYLATGGRDTDEYTNACEERESVRAIMDYSIGYLEPQREKKLCSSLKLFHL